MAGLRRAIDLAIGEDDLTALTYIITTRRMTSGELLKYRNGLLIAQAYHGQKAWPAFGLTKQK